MWLNARVDDCDCTHARPAYQLIEVIEEHRNKPWLRKRKVISNDATGIETLPDFQRGMNKNGMKEDNWSWAFFLVLNFRNVYHSSYASKSSYNSRLFSKTTISFLWYVMFYFCFLQIPLFQRGGSIIATKQRIRRCSALMHNDPYTLTLALSPNVRTDSFIVNFKHVTEVLHHW